MQPSDDADDAANAEQKSDHVESAEGSAKSGQSDGSEGEDPQKTASATVSPHAAPDSDAEAEDDAGNGPLFAIAGLAAGGVGAVVIAGAAASVAVAVVATQNGAISANSTAGAPAQAPEARAQQTGTRWAATGIGY